MVCKMKYFDDTPVPSEQETHDRGKNGKTDDDDIGFHEEAVNRGEEGIGDPADQVAARPSEEGEPNSFLRVVAAPLEFSAVEVNLMPPRHLPVDGEVPERAPAAAMRVCNMVVGIIGDLHSRACFGSGPDQPIAFRKIRQYTQVKYAISIISFQVYRGHDTMMTNE